MMKLLRNIYSSKLSRALLLAAAFCAVPSTRPQEGAHSPAIAIKAARLVDVRNRTVMNNPVVLIEGDTIQAVGSALKIPSGASILDLGESTLLPGLIDCHTHLLTSLDSTKGDDEDAAILSVVKLSTAERALLGAANAREMLEAGFTTVRDLGNSGLNGDVALRNAIRAGWVEGPNMVVSTRALAGIGGQAPSVARPAQILVNEEYAIITGDTEARKAVRQAAYDGADLIKVIVDGSATTLTQSEMVAIVDEAHRAHLKVAAHATSSEAVQVAVTAGVDSVEHAYEVSDGSLEEMAKKGIFLVPTDGPADSYMDKSILTFDEQRKSQAQMTPFVDSNRHRLQRALRAGVPIAAGSDIYFRRRNITRGQASLRMLRAYADSGMPPVEVMRTATLNAARLLGMENQRGSIEAKYSADIIALRLDPLADINALNHIEFVMKGGVVVKNTLQPTGQRQSDAGPHLPSN